MSATTTVGVIGLGSMGRPMARNLANAGHRVRGFDISERAMASAVADGVSAVPDAASLAAQCELVITMVWDDDALREVLFGATGVTASAPLPQCVVDLSTTSVSVAREAGRLLAERGVAFLDGAIIGGGAPAAKAGTSPIVMAGERATFDRYLSVLARLGTCDYVGAQGLAKVVKIINNLLVGVVTAANAEALSLGVAMGLELRELVELMGQSCGSSRVLQSYMGRFVEEGRYGDGLIGHRLMAKDLRLAADLAEEVDCPATLPRFAEHMYVAFGRALGAERPFPSAYEYFRQVNGGSTDGSRGAIAPESCKHEEARQ